ncbi:MSHA biogenesis protein MshF [Vibrio ichthyoenteri ATCC 700023]|uniref:MSHA biogenesis protein MshF n=1 Tax=Vibrio ichthyoenteri ATCC 700023 TaxID=870968 RepID=F9S1H6_9VIBR|nr:hypothetical protein [Vibrio ichthyoenteri]EGU41682.1 MSHA biogenesis protein MshF [Vibrio ichthyoenteri ATCC 700023]
MPLKGSLLANLDRSRWVVWLMVLLAILLAFIWSWQKVEQEASDTALTVASKRIVERANYYKQQWLLSGQPQQLTIEGRPLIFTHSGWVIPQKSANKTVCDDWLDVLYQERKVLESLPEKIIDNSDALGFQCEYSYSREHAIYVQLKNNKFSVSVSFSSEYVF